jgi:hypothetical protein
VEVGPELVYLGDVKVIHGLGRFGIPDCGTSINNKGGRQQAALHVTSRGWRRRANTRRRKKQ